MKRFSQTGAALVFSLVPAFTAAAGGFSLSAGTIDFGYQLVGTSGIPMVETLTNSTADPLVLAGISVTGRDRGDFQPSFGFALPVTGVSRRQRRHKPGLRPVFPVEGRHAGREARDLRVAAGTAVPQGDLDGYFSLPDFIGDPAIPEALVRIRGQEDGSFVFSHAGLTDLSYVLTVTDSSSGAVSTYANDTSDNLHPCGGSAILPQ